MSRTPPSNHRMIGELVQQYQDRIYDLEDKILGQQIEILSLQKQINELNDSLN